MAKTLSRKELEKKYNCKIFKDSGFDNTKKYWVALGSGNSEFEYAYGWTLRELSLAIERNIAINKLADM